jgi:DNA-binding protein HU-beta
LGDIRSGALGQAGYWSFIKLAKGVACETGNSAYIRAPFQKSNDTIMTKADIVTQISNKTGIDRNDVLAIVEGFMVTVKSSLENGENVYLRGFGSFVVKKRAAKLGRNILANTTVSIPAHHVPAFRPAKEFTNDVKARAVDTNG